MNDPLILPPRKTIRTDHFKTRERSSTRGAWIRFTQTINDNRIDAVFLDEMNCKSGYFGCVFHYIVRTDGSIETGRDPKTTSSVGNRMNQPEQIVIGVVGGLSLEGNLVANHTPEQDASLEWLLQALADTLNVPLLVTDDREKAGIDSHSPPSDDLIPEDDDNEDEPTQRQQTG